MNTAISTMVMPITGPVIGARADPTGASAEPTGASAEPTGSSTGRSGCTTGAVMGLRTPATRSTGAAAWRSAPPAGLVG